jgi:hypothetical protein
VRQALEDWLKRANVSAFSTYAIVAAFSAYFCMYAFRKPFGAAHFSGEVGEVDLKIALVVSQVVGYALSKFLGISLVSGMDRSRRAVMLVGLIAAAELAWVAFGLLPPSGQIVAIFFNGLPLGMVWGLVFSFLEGRQTSELLGAGLSTSYIVASGAVKSVGKWLLLQGVPESWMPAMTGAFFALPFLVAVWMLDRLPAPTGADEEARTHRQSMNGQDRRSFFATFAPGLVLLTGLYMFLTAYRDFRDNFAAEIWAELGEEGAAIFTKSELWVAFVVMAALAAIYRIRDNRRAFFLIHWVMFGGAALVGAATFAFDQGWVDGLTWMILVGTGLYLAYVPYGCVLFDRLIAATHVVATSVFMIYVTDAFGYVGSILIVLFKNFGDAELSWLDFFRGFSYVTSAICCACFLGSMLYFREKTKSVPS